MSRRTAMLMCVAACTALCVSDLFARDQPAIGAERSSQGPRRSSHELDTRVYPVGDLVLPIPSVVVTGDSIVSSQNWHNRAPEFEPLIEKITSTIQPDSWKESIGSGVIEPAPRTLSVVVRQTEAVHEEIAELIGRMRRELDLQVSVEIRRVHVPEEFLKKPFGNSDLASGQQILDQQEMNSLLRGLQSDARANLYSAPKITFFNGQTVWLHDEVEGNEKSVLLSPTLSSDRRSVTLVAAASAEREGRGVILSETYRVPDGETVLIDCGVVTEGTRELLLITPKMIVIEEEEERLGGAVD